MNNYNNIGILLGSCIGLIAAKLISNLDASLTAVEEGVSGVEALARIKKLREEVCGLQSAYGLKVEDKGTVTGVGILGELGEEMFRVKADKLEIRSAISKADIDNLSIGISEGWHVDNKENRIEGATDSEIEADLKLAQDKAKEAEYERRVRALVREELAHIDSKRSNARGFNPAK